MKLIHTACLALAVLALAACGARNSALPATQNAPKFESAVANEFVKAYSEVANEVAAAYRSKDSLKIVSLSPKLMEAGNKGVEALKSLKAPDATKLQEWLAAVGQQLEEARQKTAK